MCVSTLGGNLQVPETFIFCIIIIFLPLSLTLSPILVTVEFGRTIRSISQVN